MKFFRFICYFLSTSVAPWVSKNIFSQPKPVRDIPTIRRKGGGTSTEKNEDIIPTKLE